VPRDHFDLDAVKKNWDRAVPPEGAERSVERFASATPPRDPYPVARELLTRARARAFADFEAHAPVLASFFDQASVLVDRMDAWTRAAGRPEADPDEMIAMRKELESAIVDLEDLFEVFAGIGR
jgi:hypothetical protein